MLMQSEHFRRYAFLLCPQYQVSEMEFSLSILDTSITHPNLFCTIIPLCSIINGLNQDGENFLSSAWIFLMLSTMLSVDASEKAIRWHFHVLNPLAGTSKCAIHSYPSSLRYACFITGVAILRHPALVFPKSEIAGGSEICHNNINHILEGIIWRLKQRLTLPGRNATSRSNISLALKQL